MQDSPYLVPFDGTFRCASAASSPPRETSGDNKQFKRKLAATVKKISDLQQVLYAHDYHSVLLIFQALDSAGKDGTIRAILSGVNPAGCQVYSFKQPSREELDHDFLWRTTCRLPERGKIGVFNRSYYEDVLVVRVHPEHLRTERLHGRDIDQLWQDRYQSIRNHEHHLAQSGMLILKFWLNISKEEQRRRFLSRLNRPEKHWKFSESDIVERGYWDSYMHAYEIALNETSRPWAPWFVVPADNKPFMRSCVADIVLSHMSALRLQYPTISDADKSRFKKLKALLEKA